MRTPSIAAVIYIGILAGSMSVSATQVDQDWLARWREAQTHRTANLAARSRIAPVTEPGIPLVIEGQVVAPDGVTPEEGAVVFAYHTGNDGLYSSADRPGHPWRLQGWAKTDAEGRFEFRTIRPAPYPNRKVPAHVHLTIETSAFGRQWSGLQFADDPLVTVADREASTAAGRFGGVLNVTRDGGVQRIQLNIRLKPKGDF
jgi:protocatechuate 3,4-dioxygenase, beta subunit